MRRSILLLLALLALGSAAVVLRRGEGPDRPRPSVLLISIDTCRSDALGFLGRQLEDGRSPTPVMDALAAQAFVAEAGFSPVPLTLPAHVTLFSGLLPDATGVRENDSFKVPPLETRGYSLLAEDLRAAGYDTAAFVSGQPLERRYGLASGFRIYDQPPRGERPDSEMHFRERSAEATTAEALRFLAQSGDRPFFLFVHYFDPHHPYERPVEDPALPEGAWGDYLSEIMLVDREIGRLLAALPEGGRDTIVAIVSDHGEGLGEHGEPTHGYLLHDTTLRVPVVVKLPEARGAPRRDAALPRLADLHPTILELTGAAPVIDVPRDGRSLLQAPNASWTATAETLYPYYQFRYARLRSLRDRELKLVESGDRRELYRTGSDPGELVDLAASEPSSVQALWERLQKQLLRRRPGRADDVAVEPNAFIPYMGGRPLGLPVEPTEDENRTLPHVEDRFATVRALDEARQLIRDGKPAEAAYVLSRHQEELDTNPSLLFWLARAQDLAGRKRELSREARLVKLDEAKGLYERHLELHRDPRTLDALLKLFLERHQVTADPADLQEVERRASAVLNAGGGTALTLVFRAQARERLGDLEGALADFGSAERRDPDDARIRRDRMRLEHLLDGRRRR